MIQKIEKYFNGEKDGIFKNYDENGKIIFIQNWSYGVLYDEDDLQDY